MFSFIETRLFTRLVLEYLSDDEYGALQQALVEDPDSGPRLGAGSAVGTASSTT
jgi:hypothetical protein